MSTNKTSYIWAVAGIYLMYLGYEQFSALFKGTASLPVLSIISGLVFIVFGGAVVYREWRNYRRQTSQSNEEEIVEVDGSECEESEGEEA